MAFSWIIWTSGVNKAKLISIKKRRLVFFLTLSFRSILQKSLNYKDQNANKKDETSILKF